MQPVPLGNTGLFVSPLGFGAFKIGRNQGIKYPTGYDLPDEPTVERLLNTVLDLGVTYIDTAPAYGLSEERIGKFLSRRRSEFVLSTKVGETFADGQSSYNFSGQAVRVSVERSLKRLQTDVLDIVFIHSDGNDCRILDETDCVATLLELKNRGLIRAVGFSGKTAAGAEKSLAWADAIMVEYHLNDRSHEAVIQSANQQGIGVVVKKGLSAGQLKPDQAIPFVLRNPHVHSLVVGGLRERNIRDNILLVNRLSGPDTAWVEKS